MSIDVVLGRNAEKGHQLSTQDLALVPRLRTIVLTCADHRVDPAHVLGLDLGDAVVLRNPGGRVTTDVIRSLAILAAVAAGEEIDPSFDVIVMHHTDCGLSRLAGAEHAELIADFTGVEPDDVPGLHVDDPIRSVQRDIDSLAALGIGSTSGRLVGVVFDLETGLVRQHAG